MDFSTLSYPQLKAECAKRGLGGAGTRVELLTRLAEDDPGWDYDPPSEPDAKPQPPPFSNWDEAGRWVRRPKGFVSWADEKRKWEEKNGRNHDSTKI
jgi:hypothetical protein